MGRFPIMAGGLIGLALLVAFIGVVLIPGQADTAGAIAAGDNLVEAPPFSAERNGFDPAWASPASEEKQERPSVPDAAELLEWEIRVTIASMVVDLDLTEKDIGSIAAAYSAHQSMKALFEQSIIEKTSFDGSSLILRIPPYPEAGRDLRDRFYGVLLEALGDNKFQRVDEHLGTFFDSRFLGFGVTEQTFRIEQDASLPGTFTVVRSAIRQPGLTTWGIETPNSFGGSVSTAWPTIKGIKGSEYEAVLPYLEKEDWPKPGDDQGPPKPAN